VSARGEKSRAALAGTRAASEEAQVETLAEVMMEEASAEVAVTSAVARAETLVEVMMEEAAVEILVEVEEEIGVVVVETPEAVEAAVSNNAR